MSIVTIQPDLFPVRRPIPVERLPEDITANRHRGAETSVEANTRVDKAGDRAKVLAIIKERGNATLKEIAAAMGREKNCISGRLSELKTLGIIEVVKGERREGCSVVRVCYQA